MTEKLRCEKCGAKESWGVTRGPTKPTFTCSSCGHCWTCGLSGGKWMLPNLAKAYASLPPYQEPFSINVKALITAEMGRRRKKQFEKRLRNPAMNTDSSRLFAPSGKTVEKKNECA